MPSRLCLRLGLFFALVASSRCALKETYFFGHPGCMFNICKFIHPSVSRLDCIRLCVNSSKCFAFNTQNSMCMTCETGMVSLLSCDPQNTRAAFVKANVIVENLRPSKKRFIKFPIGLQEGQVITLVGIPNGEDFSFTFATSDWDLDDTTSQPGKADRDLEYHSFFQNGSPTNVMLSNYDPNSGTWTLMNKMEFAHSNIPYLEVGKLMTIMVWLKNAQSYHITTNGRQAGTLARSGRVTPEEIRYILIPPIIKRVQWYDDPDQPKWL